MATDNGLAGNGLAGNGPAATGWAGGRGGDGTGDERKDQRENETFASAAATSAAQRPTGSRGLRLVPDAGSQSDPRKEIEPRIARMEQEMEDARRQGVWGLWRLRYEAWLEERMKGPAIMKLQARQAVLEQQCKTAEAEIRLKATVQSGEVGAQRHRIEWNEVNRQRLAGELQSLGLVTLSPGPAPAAPPPVSSHVTDEQVEAVALRGFLLGVQTETEWLTYKAELSRHLAPYAVEEVGQRLRELWHLNRQAQGVA